MPNRSRSHADVMKLIKADVARLGSQTALAKEIGMNAMYLSDIIRGQRQPGPKLLAYYNLRASRVYVEQAS
jgi:hypothetical protein